MCVKKHESRCFRLRLGLGIIVGLLYMEDQTPTHSAQEILGDEDHPGKHGLLLVLNDDSDDPILLESVALDPTTGLFRPDRIQNRTVGRIEPYSIASLTSRPPPAV